MKRLKPQHVLRTSVNQIEIFSFGRKFFDREYIQCSNLPGLIQFKVVGSLSSKLSFTKDGHRFSVGNHFGVLPPRRTSWCVECSSVF